MPPQRAINYIRFSPPSFASIMESMNLGSGDLVVGVIRTVVFGTITTAHDHLSVSCDDVNM